MEAKRKGCDGKEKVKGSSRPSKRSSENSGGNQSSEGSLEKRRDIDCCGLQNQGATCYQNSVLQMLYMTPEFKEAVSSEPSPDGGTVLVQLKKLFQHMDDGKLDSVFLTHEISSSLEIYNVYEQEDAVEYFQKILNAVGPDVSKVYRGTMLSTTTCQDKHESSLEENFITIPISMEGAKEQFSVEEALKTFSTPIQLHGKYCCTCQSKTLANIKYTIDGYPTILSLYLKRFDHDDHMNYVKNTCPVAIPTTVNVEVNKYSLYGILNHFGSIHGGHYTAWLKSANGKWYNCDDSHVSVMEGLGHKPIRLKSAYLLMYKTEKEDPTSNDSPNASSASVPKPTSSPITHHCADAQGQGVQEPLITPEAVETNPNTSLMASVPKPTSSPETHHCADAESTTGPERRECSYIKVILWTAGLSILGVIGTGTGIGIWWLLQV